MPNIFYHKGSLLSLNKPSDWYKSDVEMTMLETSLRKTWSLSKQAIIVSIHTVRATLRL